MSFRLRSYFAFPFLAGFGLALLTMLFGSFLDAGFLTGQLIPGDPGVNAEYYTTNKVLSDISFYEVIANSCTSRFWWTGVFILTVVFGVILIKLRGVRWE